MFKIVAMFHTIFPAITTANCLLEASVTFSPSTLKCVKGGNTTLTVSLLDMYPAVPEIPDHISER